jgi:hypothetical protein
MRSVLPLSAFGAFRFTRNVPKAAFGAVAPNWRFVPQLGHCTIPRRRSVADESGHLVNGLFINPEPIPCV